MLRLTSPTTVRQDSDDSFLDSLPLLGSAKTSNKKVKGPTYNVGLTIESAADSCRSSDCPFFPKSKGGTGGLYRVMDGARAGDTVDRNETEILTHYSETEHEIRVLTGTGDRVELISPCYAVQSSPMWAHSSQAKAFAKGRSNGIAEMLNKANPKAYPFVRGAGNGNLSTLRGMTERIVERLDSAIRARGFGHILYDHAWKQNPWILKFATASLNSVDDLPLAIAMGARTASTVALSDAHRRKLMSQVRERDDAQAIWCPAESHGRSCQQCGLCDPSFRPNSEGKTKVIFFTNHANSSHTRQLEVMRRSTNKWLEYATVGCDVEDYQSIVQALASVPAGTKTPASTLKLENVIRFWNSMEEQ